MNNYDLYDKVNTIAVNWLSIYMKNIGKPLGIKNFNEKNKKYLWFLKNINIVSIINGYKDYYVECNIITWIKFKYFKHFKHMKKISFYSDIDSIEFIDIEQFIKEICLACDITIKDIEDMFIDYWRI